MRFAETPAGCLEREFKEETGLVVRVHQRLEVVSDVGVLVREPVRLHSVRIIYRADVDEAPVRPETDGSTGAVRWVPDRELEALELIPWLRQLVEAQLIPG